MKFSEIVKQLGIESYPPELDEIYENKSLAKPDVCDESLITNLQNEFNTFGDYYQLVLEAARELRNDPVRLAWAQTVATYDLRVDLAEARKVLCPQSDGSLLGNMLPLFALIPMIPVAIDEYRRRGFTDDVIQHSAKAFGSCIGAVDRNTGAPGLNQLYFTWLCVYAKARIFLIANFNFEVKSYPSLIFCLRNRETGEIVILAAKRTMHRSGLFLGSAGCTDPDGSFEVDFQETDDAYIGYPTENNVFINMRKTYPKSQWECIVRPNDYVLNFHIPSGFDLSPSSVTASIRIGMDAVKKYYPEIPITTLVCSSWLLNPILEEFLGEASKIAGFGRMFHRFPVGGGGRAGFGFIFPGKYDDEKSLPENTSLQRAVKNHFLNGGNLLSFGGVFIDE